MLIHKISFAFTLKANKVIESVLKWKETCPKRGSVGERPDCRLWVRETCLGLSASMSHLTACDLARLLNISEPSSSKGSETRTLLPTTQDGCAQSVTEVAKWHGALYTRLLRGQQTFSVKGQIINILVFVDHRMAVPAIQLC